MLKKGSQYDILAPWLGFGLLIATETAMGTSVNAQTNKDHPYVHAVEDINEMAFFYNKNFWWWFTPTWYLSGAAHRYNKNLSILKEFTQKVTNERISEYERLGGWSEDRKRRPFLDMLIELRKDRGLSYEDILNEVNTFMFAGHDTTGSGIGWTLWLLAHENECQQKVIDEQQDIFGGTNRECTVEDLKKMRYLDKCIKESLRLRPPVPQFTRKVEETVEIEGYTIPKGCTLVIAPRFIHNNKNVFENPEIFDPERFNEDRLAGRDPYAYVPFSAGPRNCIGQKFAVQEEKTILSWLFRNFRFSASIPRDENHPLPEIITRPWKAATCIPEKMKETYLYLGDQATDAKGRECLRWRDVYARFEKLRKDYGAKSEPPLVADERVMHSKCRRPKYPDDEDKFMFAGKKHNLFYNIWIGKLGPWCYVKSATYYETAFTLKPGKHLIDIEPSLCFPNCTTRKPRHRGSTSYSTKQKEVVNYNRALIDRIDLMFARYDWGDYKYYIWKPSQEMFSQEYLRLRRQLAAQLKVFYGLLGALGLVFLWILTCFLLRRAGIKSRKRRDAAIKKLFEDRKNMVIRRERELPQKDDDSEEKSD
ncbi:hypothetical protein WR25_22799 [Diploscapter pachys]|uniref:Kringle-like domain-containing protein n=1 Tax=Diploscapter pachys TaxID=2018661 RepID=A0A2A2JJJ6_9BILA|nr:hypothetical protein WR25_22799 [Diploscapter pachys]